MGYYPLLELRNICKSYNKGKVSETILEHVSMTMGQGQIVVLKGESGSGKSTIARIVSRLESFERGSLFFRGIDYSNFGYNKMQKIRADMACILQHSKSSFSPYYSLHKLVTAPAIFYHKRDRITIEKELEELLESVCLNKSILSKKIDEISGGEADCLAIFRALLGHPSLLIMDEVMSGLDLMIKLLMLNKLKDINRKKNTSYLIISHNFNDEIIMNAEVYSMRGGIVIKNVEQD